MFDFCFYALIIFLIYTYFQLGFNSLVKKKNTLNNISFCLVLSSIQFFIISLIQESEYSMYFGAFFITYLFLFVFNLFFSYFKHYKLLQILFSFLLFLYSIIQRYVVLFKGVPFSISDLKAIKTALSVAKGYDYTPTKGMIFGFLVFLFLIVFILKVKFKSINLKCFWITFICSFIILTSILSSFYINRENVEKLGNVNLYEPMATLSDYGALLNLYINYIYSIFEYPEDYNPQDVESTLNKIILDKNDKDEQAVNIICILDESFFDLSLVKDIEPSEDYLEYYHSLDENTIKGYTVVSAFGGGTANSEYEFLTNSNMAFLPKSSYPFAKYINNNTISLASVLKNLDYKTIAYHPYLKDSWNRDYVYPFLGFDEYYAYLDRFDETTQSYLIRNLLSDEGDFKELIKLYEEKDEDEKLFIYNVTIQNHSGYAGYPEINEVVDSNYNNQELNTYLTLIKYTDNAIKELIEYFDNVDEPTLICIFGDHIPGTLLDIKEDFGNDLEYSLNFYKTPFLIHTNYDIDKTYYENISLSYLSTLVMDYANLPKTKEQTFVQSFMDNYPILNKSIYGKENSLYSTNELPKDLKLWRDFSYKNLSP